jgi:hypothetical protein
MPIVNTITKLEHPNAGRSASADKLFKETECKLINGNPVKISDVKVHEFTMGDVEDPDLYAAEPLYEWQQSEQGQWIMEHAVETPFWHRQMDVYQYGYKYCIIARLLEQDQTYWALKWQK